MNYPKNKNEKKFMFLAAMTLTVCLISCKKLIEIPASQSTQVSTERAYSDSLNVTSALVGIYTSFATGSYVSNINGGLLTQYTGMSADEIVYNSPGQALFDEFATNNLQVTNNSVNSMWASSYQGIYNVNAFLEGVTGNNKITTTFQNQVRGEALTTRALYYFNLVNLFGGVPLVTTTDFKVNAVKPRSSVDEVYAQIINDLTIAVSLLKDKYPSAGRLRPNINTARALLARVYLYRGQWKDASDMATLVINSGLYDLVLPNQTFLDGSREAIWQVPNLDPYSQTGETWMFVPYANNIVPSYIFVNNLRNAFEINDKRLATWTGTNVVAGVSYTYPAKYKNFSNTDTPVEDYMIFRIAEQYLIRAEALANQDLLTGATGAIADINRIRTRAGLGPTAAVTKSNVLEAIAKERQTELFCEWGHRWYDLKRTGQATAVLSPIKPNWAASDMLYPIPANEIKTNQFLVQNPGY